MTNLITRKGDKLTLNNDLLTGNTFAIKSYISTYLDGKWVADKKAWRINTEKLNALVSASNSIGLRIDTDAAPTKPAAWTYEHFRRSADDPNSDY